MKYYLIAGEASGDLHGANLMRELKALDGQADIRAWGGDQMEEQGATLVKHIRDLAFMGFVEVVANLRTILGNMDVCKKDIEQFQPDVLVLIDYPGFNLRIAEWAHHKGIKVLYYISPQVWAWKKSRVKKIKRFVNKMLVILPFEKAFYQQYGYEVEFVGHPLCDAIGRMKEENVARPDKPVIALLPGSRKQEIEKMLPVMVSAAEKLGQEYEYIVAAAPAIDRSFYQNFLEGKGVQLSEQHTYGLLQQATAAMVTSGTATLETALFQVPEVVCYKGNALSYQIAKRLVDIEYISLVNLIMEKEVVKELIQDEMTADNIVDELKKVLPGGEIETEIRAELQKLKEKLGDGGASKKAAQAVFKMAQA